MFLVLDIEKMHRLLIDSFGGAHGIREKSALISALARPFQTFDGQELYPSIVEKAASLLESILINHPFIDGNKRLGYFLLRNYLIGHKIDIVATQDEKYEFIINVASGHLKFDGIVTWLKENTTATSI